MRVEAHDIHAIDDSGRDTGKVIATVRPAPEDLVREILAADEDSEDGRSQFLWVRLSSGDLILGCFPQGDTYFATETDKNRP